MRGQSHPFVTPTFVRFNVALSAMLLLSTAAQVAAQQQTAKPKRVDPVTATQENDAGTTGIEARAEEGAPDFEDYGSQAVVSWSTRTTDNLLATAVARQRNAPPRVGAASSKIQIMEVEVVTSTSAARPPKQP